jgi:HEAT repeat protein
MSKGGKRWIAAGLLVTVIGAGTLLLRQHRANEAIRLRAADGSSLRDLEANRMERPGSLIAPETAEQIAKQVDSSVAAWRQAIVGRDADTVMTLDRAFQASPDRYRAALETSAKSDADDRVRAFSTRVLGRQKNAALAELFQALLADRSPFVRQNAAWALGELAAQDDGRAAARHAVAELRRARAKDPVADVRTAATGALARLE